MQSQNIRYKSKKDAWLISPIDKAGFLRDLAQNAGGLEVRDDGVVRLA